jgi:hypothetical protein
MSREETDEIVRQRELRLIFPLHKHAGVPVFAFSL